MFSAQVLIILSWMTWYFPSACAVWTETAVLQCMRPFPLGLSVSGLQKEPDVRQGDISFFLHLSHSASGRGSAVPIVPTAPIPLARCSPPVAQIHASGAFPSAVPPFLVLRSHPWRRRQLSSLEMHYLCKLKTALSLKSRAGEYERGANYLGRDSLGSFGG